MNKRLLLLLPLPLLSLHFSLPTSPRTSTPSQLQTRKMQVGILGPTGFSGSHVAIELLNRGHQVVGFSRHPERLGQHDNYTPVPLTIEKAAVTDLVAAFSGLDVLVNAYNPSPGPGVYSKPSCSPPTNHPPLRATDLEYRQLIQASTQKPSSKPPASSSSPSKP